LQLAMPTALAAVGEAFSERAGVLNLGLEGMMLCAALASFSVAYYTDAAVGVLAGVVTGMLVGALMAFLSVTLKTEQVINGMVIVIFAQGIPAFAYERIFGGASTQPEIPALGVVRVPGL